MQLLRTLLTRLDREDEVIHQLSFKTAIIINVLLKKLARSILGNGSLFLHSNKIYLLVIVCCWLGSRMFHLKNKWTGD